MGETERAYETLGLGAGASFKEVMEAHRDLADVWDPERFPNNPRLHKKATEKLRAINTAFELLRVPHLKALSDNTAVTPDFPAGTELSPAPVDSGHPIELAKTPEPDAAEDSRSLTASLYEGVFSDHIAQSGKRIPIWFIPVPIFVLLVVVIYLVTPAEEEKKQLFEFSQVTNQPSGSEEITGEEVHGPAESSDRPNSDQKGEDTVLANVEIERKSTARPSTPKKSTTGSASSPRTAAQSAVPKPTPLPKPLPVTAKSAMDPSKKPLLRRGAPPPEEGDAESQPAAALQDDFSNLAFQMLKDESTVVSKLVGGEIIADLRYWGWKTVRQNGPKFWIDLIAYRSTDRAEFHLIWLVNTDTGTVTPLSQAARDLQSRLVPPQDS